MSQIYDLVNLTLLKQESTLSEQGKASLRRLINADAVKDGYIFPYDKEKPGWRITPQARDLFLEQPVQPELVFNQETKKEEVFLANTVRGALFENYCLGLLKKIYPFYSWFHQKRKGTDHV